MNREKRVAYHLVFAIYVSIGSIFLLVAGLLFISACIDTLLFLVKAESVQGTIIELIPKPNDGLERYFLKVAFREESTKRRYKLISSLSFSKTANNEDEIIKVFYDPENPYDAKIGVVMEFIEWQLFLLFPGAFLFVTGFFLIREGYRIMRHKEMR